MNDSVRSETVIIGGGQAGLATGYWLSQLGRPFVILEARKRIGDVWRSGRTRLRLYSPARYAGLPGMSSPGAPWSFPSKDEMADYLEERALSDSHRVGVERVRVAGGGPLLRHVQRRHLRGQPRRRSIGHLPGTRRARVRVALDPRIGNCTPVTTAIPLSSARGGPRRGREPFRS